MLRLVTMNGGQYAEMFEAILSLREAVELGFNNARSEFREELRAEIGALDERWNRRFNALEARVETGFAEVTSSFAEVDRRFDEIDRRFAQVDGRFSDVFVSLRSIEGRLELVERQ